MISELAAGWEQGAGNPQVETGFGGLVAEGRNSERTTVYKSAWGEANSFQKNWVSSWG